MKKFLQLDSSSCRSFLTQDQDGVPYLSVNWNLNFTYLIENIYLCLNPKYQSNLLINKLRICSASDTLPSTQIIVIDRIVDEQKQTLPVFFQKLKLEKAAYVFNTLLLEIEIAIESENRMENEGQKRLETEVVKMLGFEGLEIVGFNVDIYQPLQLQDKQGLISLYSKLLTGQHNFECSLCYFHLGLIAKNGTKQVEAEEIFKKLLKDQVSRHLIGENMLILSIIDSSSKESTKVEYLIKLSKTYIDTNSQSYLFKYSQLFIVTLLQNLNTENYILTTTIFNILNFFINKIGCSAAPFYQTILLHMFSAFNNKSFIKNLRRQSLPNYELLVSCIDQFLEALRQCLSYLPSCYHQKLCRLILTQIYKPNIEPIQQMMAKLLTTLLKQCEGGVEVRYDDWIRLVYLLQGEQMIDGTDITHDMFYNKNLNGMQIIYELYKNNVLICIADKNRQQFLDSLNNYFTEIIYNKNINTILMNHFVDIISLFCTFDQESQMFNHSRAMLQFLQPQKALIYKIIQDCSVSETQFHKIWEAFLLLFSVVKLHIEDSLNDIIIMLLNKFTKDGINHRHILYFPVIISSFISDNKYPQFWEKFAKNTATSLPNSLHPDKIYDMLHNIIELAPKILETEALAFVVSKLIDPYSNYSSEWIEIIESIKNSEAFTEQILIGILQLTISPFKSKTKSRISECSNYKKEQVQRESRKIYLINKLLSNKVVSESVLTLISSATNQIATQILNFPEQLKSIMYYKYHYLQKILTHNQVPVQVQHFKVLSLQYPPITFNFLTSLASSRQYIKEEHYYQLHSNLLPLIEQPWKNIQQLSIQLLVYFNKHSLNRSMIVVNELLDSKQMFKTTMALTILYQINSMDFEQDQVSRFLALLKPVIQKFQQIHYIKEMDILTKYTLCALNKKFELGLDIRQQAMSESEYTNMLMTFDYEKRIDLMVRKEFDKPIQSVLRLDDSLRIPKKYDDYRHEMEVDEVEIGERISAIEEKLKEKEKDRGKEASKEREKQKQKEQQKNSFAKKEKQRQKNRFTQKQVSKDKQTSQFNLSGDLFEIFQTEEIKAVQTITKKQKQQPKQQIIQQNNTISQQESINISAPKQKLPQQKDSPFSPLKKSTASKIVKSKYLNTTPNIKFQQEFGYSTTTKSNPSNKKVKKSKHVDSPTVEIESKNAKFKINLGQLNKTWRESMCMISRKPKQLEKKQKIIVRQFE